MAAGVLLIYTAVDESARVSLGVILVESFTNGCGSKSRIFLQPGQDYLPPC